MMRPAGKIILKELLTRAEKAVSNNDKHGAISLFEQCIEGYLDEHMGEKALAVAKHEKTLIGPIPKVQAHLIRLYLSLGLSGDARKEYEECSNSLDKDNLPIFKDLDQGEFTSLMSIMDILDIPKGRAVIQQHEKGEDIYIVLSGKFDVIRGLKRITTMDKGDIFGELGFFYHQKRSATIRSQTPGRLIGFNASDLRDISSGHPSIKDALDLHYTKRVLKKTIEDLGPFSLVDLTKDSIACEYYTKGEDIPIDRMEDIAVVKHGILEVNYHDKGPAQKKFFRPGSIIKDYTGSLKAWSDCELLKVRIDLFGKRNP